MDPKLVKVSKAEFFAKVGSQNVHPRVEKDASYWETPSRQLLGVSTPGYMCEGPYEYFMTQAEADRPLP
jgi:hypothetical protein